MKTIELVMNDYDVFVVSRQLSEFLYSTKEDFVFCIKGISHYKMVRAVRMSTSTPDASIKWFLIYGNVRKHTLFVEDGERMNVHITDFFNPVQWEKPAQEISEYLAW
jgi:hypothetical protein